MLCKKCKKTYDDSFLFCPYCGKKKDVVPPNGGVNSPTRYQMIRGFSDEELVDFAQNIPKDNAESIRAFLGEKLPRKCYVVGTRTLDWWVLKGGTPHISKRKDGHIESYERLQEYLSKRIESFCNYSRDNTSISIRAKCFYIEEAQLSVSHVPHICKTVFFDESSIPYDIKKMQVRSGKIQEWFETCVEEETKKLNALRGYDPARW